MRTAILGALAGAGVMYFFDTDHGRRRRARTRDKLLHQRLVAERTARITFRDVTHRLYGLSAELSGLLSRRPGGPEVLEARVRAKLGHVCSHPGAIEVIAYGNDTIGLRGPILASERDRVVHAVRGVRGVREVNDSDLIGHESAEGISDLQGGTPRLGQRFELMQRHWSPAARLLVGLAGAGMFAMAAGQRTLWRPLLRTVGLLTVGRAATNMEVRQLLGLGGEGIEVTKSIAIDAPRDEVFSFFAALENFPKFMAHVREVKDHGGGRYYWEVEGPAHTAVGWEAEITRLVTNELMCWKSLPGSAVGNSGEIRFEDTDTGGTRVHIRLWYQPPAGAIGHALAKLTRTDPKYELDDDMIRLKSILEDGITSKHGRKIHRDDILEHPH